ncbi:odorant binding protein [Nephila pilipes]|uniref:Odorant binding protein n=1 Tax=Nephila pilipes TaxID=299642 RepID=A0A8X6JR90_NEPPI|nr:odorant binding protein [Nephila pilipes]
MFICKTEQKRVVIQKCLDENPPPALETVTDPKQIDDHREIVTTCALKTEGWFNTNGTYKFDRAKSEIQSKKLDAQVEKSISQRHQECQDEAVKRFPDGFIQQVQLYQACMDYHIAEICEIELIPPPGQKEITNHLKVLKVLPSHKQNQRKHPKKDEKMM